MASTVRIAPHAEGAHLPAVHRRRRVARLATLTRLVGGTALVAGLSAGATTAGAASHVSSGTPSWMIADSAVQMLLQAGATKATIQADFNKPSTILIVPPNRTDPTLPQATLAETFSSYTALQQALSSGAVRPAVRVIVFDLEVWNSTPVDEQQHPFTYAAQAETITHQYGRNFVFAPAVNLVQSMSGNNAPNSMDKFDQYLFNDIAGRGAVISDQFEVQAQQTEGTPYASTFPQRAVSQAHNADPTGPLYIGLSTNPLGRQVTVANLTQIYNETQGSVTGYWLNIPSTGPSCKTCGPPQPAVANQFLQAVNNN